MSPFWAGVLTVVIVVATLWNMMFAATTRRYREETKAALAETGKLLEDFKTKTLEPLNDELISIRKIASSDNVDPIRRKP